MMMMNNLLNMYLSGPKITQVKLNSKFYKMNINKNCLIKVQEKFLDLGAPITL